MDEKGDVLETIKNVVHAAGSVGYEVGITLPVTTGEKVCFRAAQEDGAGNLSEPSDIVCGTALGPEVPEEEPKDSEESTAGCSCRAANGRGSSAGLAVAGLLALGVLARRRGRRGLGVDGTFSREPRRAKLPHALEEPR